MTSCVALSPRAGMVGLNALFVAAAYLSDWNHTHIYNPRWPPHAKFHNGQSMSFTAMSALTAIYLLTRPVSSNIEEAKNTLFTATVVGSLTTAAGLSAIFYPGTAWVDPEWDNGALIGPQGYVFGAQLLINWSLYSLEKAALVTLEKIQ